MIGCRGKIRYPTAMEARGVAKRVRHRRGRLVAYQCDECGNWHLGRDKWPGGKPPALPRKVLAAIGGNKP